jgi:hypothetical protein
MQPKYYKFPVYITHLANVYVSYRVIKISVSEKSS